MNRLRTVAWSTLAVVLGTGCAVRYTDAETGTVHLFGVGHLSVQTAPPIDEKMPEGKSASFVGLGLSLDEEDFGLTLGYSRRQRVRLIDPDTAVSVNASGLLIPIPTPD